MQLSAKAYGIWCALSSFGALSRVQLGELFTDNKRSLLSGLKELRAAGVVWFDGRVYQLVELPPFGINSSAEIAPAVLKQHQAQNSTSSAETAPAVLKQRHAQNSTSGAKIAPMQAQNSTAVGTKERYGLDIDKTKESNSFTVLSVKPTYDEVNVFFQSLGSPESLALKFFEYYERNGWVSSGRPVGNWRKLAAIWHERERTPQANGTDGSFYHSENKAAKKGLKKEDSAKGQINKPWYE